MPGGFALDECVQVSRWLEEAGAIAISVSAGTWHTLHVTLAPMFVPRGHMRHYAAAVKAAVDVPVIAVGRLDDPALAADVVASGDADLVLLGRTLIAEPDWPRKVEEGRLNELRPCIACNACVDLVGRGEIARCAVNPEAGRELTWTRAAPPSAAARDGRRQRPGGHGGGADRASCAATTSRSGSARTGSAASSRSPGWRRASARCCASATSSRAGWASSASRSTSTPTSRRRRSRASAPDAVLVATGAEPLIPPIPGIGSAIVHDAQRFLRDELRPRRGERVVVVGGSATGLRDRRAPRRPRRRR